jgi:DNA polymerase III epsilon subunit family exonuclease
MPNSNNHSNNFRPHKGRGNSSRGRSGGGSGSHFGKRRSKKPLAEAPPVGPEVLERIQKNIADGTYIVFDIETTGGNPERNGITEIFAIRYNQGEIKDTFYSMVNPGIPIPPIVRRMTGIDNKMVRGAPRITEVMPKVVEFIGHDILVSHNTIGDMKFIRHFAEQVCHVALQNFYLCTHLLVEKLASEAPDKSLKGLANFFELPRQGELHRAEGDAYVTLELFKVLTGRLKEKAVLQIEAAVRLQGDLESGMRLGWGIKDGSADNIPPGPGVFYLFDHDKKMIFLSSAMQLDREVMKLKTLHQLPRPLLRMVLRSYDLQVERAPNFYAALLTECEALSRHKLSFHPTGWHQRIVQTLYLLETVDGLVLGQGLLDENIIQAYGPVRDRRVVSDFIANVALAFNAESSRGDHGVILPRDAKDLLDKLFAGDLAAESDEMHKRLRSFKMLFKRQERRHLKQSLKIVDRLLAIDKKPRLEPLLNKTGLLVVPDHIAGSWQIHSIVASRPKGMMILKGDPQSKLCQGGVGRKLLDNLNRELEKLSGSPLSLQEAGPVNATLWWLFNGRSEGRFIEINELEELCRLACGALPHAPLRETPKFPCTE